MGKDNDEATINFDFGNIGLQAKQFDENWIPNHF